MRRSRVEGSLDLSAEMIGKVAEGAIMYSDTVSDTIEMLAKGYVVLLETDGVIRPKGFSDDKDALRQFIVENHYQTGVSIVEVLFNGRRIPWEVSTKVVVQL